MPLSPAERQRAYIGRLKAGMPIASKPRRPIDRRTKPQRWDDAVAELLSLLDGYQEARDNLPDSLAETAYVEKLDAILELRELVETLAEAELPKGLAETDLIHGKHRPGMSRLLPLRGQPAQIGGHRSSGCWRPFQGSLRTSWPSA